MVNSTGTLNFRTFHIYYYSFEILMRYFGQIFIIHKKNKPITGN